LQGFWFEGMSVEKQLDAAQKFLRGIRSLSSYEEIREKQALGVQKALEKVPAYTAAQAAAVLAFLSEAGTQSRVSVVPTQCLASMGSQTQSTDCVEEAE
jgi:hypothetical protein